MQSFLHKHACSQQFSTLCVPKHSILFSARWIERIIRNFFILWLFMPICLAIFLSSLKFILCLPLRFPANFLSGFFMSRCEPDSLPPCLQSRGLVLVSLFWGFCVLQSHNSNKEPRVNRDSGIFDSKSYMMFCLNSLTSENRVVDLQSTSVLLPITVMPWKKVWWHVLARNY